MTVVVTKHFRPALPRRAVGIHECLGINLEVTARIVGDVGGGGGPLERLAAPEQDAAAFVRGGALGVC